MRKWLAVLACGAMLMAGPCSFESWNIAVRPGIGHRDSVLGIQLDFGDVDFVIPLTTLGN